jgi:hypothetical protein
MARSSLPLRERATNRCPLLVEAHGAFMAKHLAIGAAGY